MLQFLNFQGVEYLSDIETNCDVWPMPIAYMVDKEKCVSDWRKEVKENERIRLQNLRKELDILKEEFLPNP